MSTFHKNSPNIIAFCLRHRLQVAAASSELLRWLDWSLLQICRQSKANLFNVSLLEVATANRLTCRMVLAETSPCIYRAGPPWDCINAPTEYVSKYSWGAGPANGMKPCRRKLSWTDILGYFSTTVFHYLKDHLKPPVTIPPHFPSGIAAASLLRVCDKSRFFNHTQCHRGGLELLPLGCSADGVKSCVTRCQVASK